EGGVLPPHLDSSAQPPVGAKAPFVMMVSPVFGYPSSYRFRQMHVDWATPANTTLSGQIVVNAASMDQNMCNFASACIAQGGTAQKVDAISDRLMFRAAVNWVNNKAEMVVNGTVDADGFDHAGIRWAQLDDVTSPTPTLMQQGTYAPSASSTNRWMGSI